MPLKIIIIICKYRSIDKYKLTVKCIYNKFIEPFLNYTFYKFKNKIIILNLYTCFVLTF